MMDLITPILGAIVGFSLAQIANLAQIGWEYFRAAKFKIGDLGTLSHRPEDDPEVIEKLYSCSVQNIGKRVAASVRFQIVKIEMRTEEKRREFDIIHHCALPLCVDDADTQDVTLVPGALVNVRLAVWREDRDIMIPATAIRPFQYYDDVARHTFEYRFTVVAFDEKGRFTDKAFTLQAEIAK